MGKTLAKIVAVVTSPLTLIDRKLGNIVRQISFTIAGAYLGGPEGAALGAAAANLIAGLSAPPAPPPEQRETTIKMSRPPRVSAYGRSRLYGAYILYETASNGVAVDIVAVHHGKVAAVERQYLADDHITMAAQFVSAGADGRYGKNKVSLYWSDGSTPGTAAFPVAISLLPGIWTASHRGDGVMVAALFCATVKAKEFQEIYPSSEPPQMSFVSQWQLCPDPAADDPLDESGWTWTECGVRHLLHYKLVREGPRPSLPKSDPGYAAALAALRTAWWARKIAPTLDTWITATAVCDAAIALKAGGTEPRYRSSVAHKHVDAHKDVEAALLLTFDGWVCPRADGAYVIYAGQYVEPDEADTIGPAEILSYTWEGGDVDDNVAVNEIACGYISAAHDYNAVDCDAWRDDDDISRRGKVLSAPLDVQIPSNGQARRLAKRRMARANARNRGTVTTNIAGRKVRGKRYIPLHLEEAGTVFYSGPVEITALTRNMRGGVTFTWVAADPNVDLWNPATEEGEPAALGDRVPAIALVAPAITSVTAAFDGDGVRLVLVVDSPDRGDLTWFVHWRKVGAVLWGPDATYPDVDEGPSVELHTDIVPANIEIEVEVAYQIGAGRVSPYSPLATVSTSDADLAPSTVTGLTIVTSGTGANVTWRNPVSANFGFVRVRRGTTPVFADATVAPGDIIGGLGAVQSVFDGGLANGTYYWWVVPYSTGGTIGPAAGPESGYVGPVTVDNTTITVDSTDYTMDRG